MDKGNRFVVVDKKTHRNKAQKQIKVRLRRWMMTQLAII